MAYYNEKLSDARKNWTAYELEPYAVIQALRVWEHYLIHQEFVLNTDNKALEFLNISATINRKHARWIARGQAFKFVLKHTAGSTNRAADALSRKASCLTIARTELIGFEFLKELYEEDPDFQHLSVQ